VDLRGWRYFLAIAEAGSVAGAARQLRIAQSALSRQLTMLENEMGAPLVVRHRRGVELTEAGILLRDRVRDLLQEVERVRNEVAAKPTEPSGRLLHMIKLERKGDGVFAAMGVMGFGLKTDLWVAKSRRRYPITMDGRNRANNPVTTASRDRDACGPNQ
jgi:molybdenum-dependent DNA-binding transcriptional regulator ModE